MAWIKQVPESQADGTLRRIYDAAIQRADRVFNILRVQSQNPPVLEASMGLYLSIMKGESLLTRAQREMLAVVVSRANRCHY